MAPPLTTHPEDQAWHGKTVFLAAIYAVFMLLIFTLVITSTVYKDWAHGRVPLNTDPVTYAERKVSLWEICGQLSDVTDTKQCSHLLDYVETHCDTNMGNFRLLQALSVIACLTTLLAMLLVPAGVAFSIMALTGVGTLVLLIALGCTVISTLSFVDLVQQENWACVNTTTAITVRRTTDEIPATGGGVVTEPQPRTISATATSTDIKATYGIGWGLLCAATILAVIASLLAVYLVYRSWIQKRRQARKREIEGTEELDDYGPSSPLTPPPHLWAGSVPGYRSPTSPLTPVLAAGDYQRYSPVAVLPPVHNPIAIGVPVGVAQPTPASATLEDPLLSRVEQVSNRLRRTLEEDRQVPSAYVPPPPVFSYQHHKPW
eukprot:TRINITY_DN103301_c0_g1_i1.p1 TRINITY_DN103301_c0_g1~~TRINITY_DN103301_c0_g1_i1.p1  ORF type:complete len:375 (-),score=17.29 TRINITY_DN103301_c0_g1_i1:142-1266(-)